jgi:hypothetical protein
MFARKKLFIGEWLRDLRDLLVESNLEFFVVQALLEIGHYL